MAEVKKQDLQLTFEQAFDKLESLVENMESGDIPLEKLITNFEQANKLLEHCAKKLKDSKLKIENIPNSSDLESGSSEAN